MIYLSLKKILIIAYLLLDIVWEQLYTLFGYELSREITNYVTVVSFASPRVGNPAFRREFDKKTNLTHCNIK